MTPIIISPVRTRPNLSILHFLIWPLLALIAVLLVNFLLFRPSLTQEVEGRSQRGVAGSFYTIIILVSALPPGRFP